MEKNIIGWHFAGTQMRDGRVLGAPGEVETWDGEVIPCKLGLHASKRIMDALRYAPGPLLRRVELWGDLQEHGGDKHVGRFRRILWEADMTHALRLFARQCALDVRHLWKMPPLVYEYLMTGDERIKAAARAAAWDAAGAAAWADARAAAWAAAGAASGDAAGAASGAAARDAAWDAARAVAWDAAGDAARAAAWDAAGEKQERRLIAYANAARCGLFVKGSVKCGI